MGQADTGSTRQASPRSGDIAVAVATLVVSVLGYGLGLAGARSLGAAPYGAFGALLALVVVGSVPALALQALAALRTARAEPGAERQQTVVAMMRAGLIAAAVVGVLALAAAPLITRFLHLGGPAPALALAFTLAPLAASGAPLGVLQGAERFRELALGLMAVGVGRFGGGIAALLVTPKVTAGLLGVAVGSTVGTVIAYWLVAKAGLAPRRRGGLDRIPSRDWVADLLRATSALLAYFVVTNVDVVLARHRLPDVEGGIYAAGGIVTRVALWLPAAAVVLALPRMAHADRRRRALRWALAGVAVCSGAVVIGVAVLPGLAVTVVAGTSPQYDPLAAFVWKFAVLGGLLAVAQVLIYARLAEGDRRAESLVWGVAAIEAAVLATVPDPTPQLLVTIAIGCVAVLVAAGLVMERASLIGADDPVAEQAADTAAAS